MAGSMSYSSRSQSDTFGTDDTTATGGQPALMGDMWTAFGPWGRVEASFEAVWDFLNQGNPFRDLEGEEDCEPSSPSSAECLVVEKMPQMVARRETCSGSRVNAIPAVRDDMAPPGLICWTSSGSSKNLVL